MLKTIKRHWRKSKNFNSAFIASMLVSFMFGKYISLLFNQESPVIWNNKLFGVLILTLILIILLAVFYKIFIPKDDFRDKQNFYDNFFISLIVVVITTLMIIYNSYLPDTLFWIGSLLIILIIYFPLNWVYIKLRPKE